ncbi:MAG: MBL fold metallo-hydrolase [Actinomycetota bacterium]|nr:MBL fold metallo-hydrolase [Actinomycetota bacterium]
MDVVLLGTSSPYPRPGNPCSSLLVRSGTTTLWVDAGSGTLAALLGHCRLEDLGGLWVSHTHADHFSDLAVTYYALRYADVHRAPLPVLGPPGWVERLRSFVTHSADPSPLESVFEVHEVSGSTEHPLGDLVLRSRDVFHGAGVAALGLRVEDAHGSLGFTGDSAPCDGLRELVSGVDVLVSEAGYGTNGPGPDVEPVHMTAAQAGALAVEARARTLVLTHLADGHPRDCLHDARLAGAREVVVAHPGTALRA